jgi:hypothetical protein
VNIRAAFCNRPTRAHALSPFAEDHGQVICFGGYDCHFKLSADPKRAR